MLYYGMTDVGAVRSQNQDTYGYSEIHLKGSQSPALLAVVCDGMGGAASGDLASVTARDCFLSYVKRQIEAFDDDLASVRNIPFEKILTDGTKYANKEVRNLSMQDPENLGMGTTLVAFLRVDSKLYAVNVGDSRMYILRDGALERVSHDHSFVQQLVDSGSITEEQAMVHPERNVILRAVGVSSDIKPDTFFVENIPERVLLCSDGLCGMVAEPELLCVLSDFERNPQAVCAECIRLANDAGGRDNITAFVADFTKEVSQYEAASREGENAGNGGIIILPSADEEAENEEMGKETGNGNGTEEEVKNG